MRSKADITTQALSGKNHAAALLLAMTGCTVDLVYFRIAAYA